MGSSAEVVRTQEAAIAIQLVGLSVSDGEVPADWIGSYMGRNGKTRGRADIGLGGRIGNSNIDDDPTGGGENAKIGTEIALTELARAVRCIRCDRLRAGRRRMSAVAAPTQATPIHLTCVGLCNVVIQSYFLAVADANRWLGLNAIAWKALAEKLEQEITN